MGRDLLKRTIKIHQNASLSRRQYQEFLKSAWKLISGFPQYFATAEDINSLELAHLIPAVEETILAVYVGINDAVCNKGIVSPLLPQHGHNNVFVFDPQVYSGADNVPGGTIDAKKVLSGFEPPNGTWNAKWTYVMIQDPQLRFKSLWSKRGYIDMVPAKFEDFTMVSDHKKSKACIFIDHAAFSHPVNKNRAYLKAARKRGEKLADEFTLPKKLKGEWDGLVPVVLNQGEKLYVATTDFRPCGHGWSNIHPDNEEFAVINENSAVPLELVIAKPPVNLKYAKGLIPPKGSADMTTDWFYRGAQIVRTPLLQGLFKG